MWLVRAGRGGEFVEDFLARGVVAFDASDLGPLDGTVTKDELLRRYATLFPNEKEGSRASWASQLYRLVREVAVGDDVACADRERRRYLLGKVVSAYEWLPDDAGRNGQARRVRWTHEVARDGLSVATRNTLGSTLTVFRIHADAAKELLAAAVPLGTTPEKPPPTPTPRTDDPDLGLISDETFHRAGELIEDRLNALTWQEMQELVAGLLRAMGFRTTVSAAGPDRGVDVMASPDGLGLQEPRIFVEVKHRTQPMGAKEVRAFLGGRRKGDRCLYVSTGGFTKDAHYEAERADVPMTLVALPRLRELFVSLYDKLDSETRALVPLRLLYWPAG
ncbi:MAG: restriction endonuclease [Deltaproteobacteria bacterium]|nr:restriction endonuclease [Deltaproteobacteria bacterium]